jgi:hypothetical protein
MYANDEAEGNGIYIYANGDVYKGQWHLGLFHGQGRKVTKSGIIFTGMFEQGYPVSGSTLLMALGSSIIQTAVTSRAPIKEVTQQANSSSTNKTVSRSKGSSEENHSSSSRPYSQTAAGMLETGSTHNPTGPES